MHPEEARNSDEQPMKAESIQCKDVQCSYQYLMKLEQISPKEAGHSG